MYFQHNDCEKFPLAKVTPVAWWGHRDGSRC